MLEQLPDIVFGFFPPILLGILSAIVAIFYLLRGCFATFFPRGMPIALKWIFFARAINWAMFAIAWFVFSRNPIEVSRALLRVTFIFMMTFELAYHGAFYLDYAKSRLKKKWKLNSS